MGFWKLLLSRFIFIMRLFIRLMLCFFAALLTTVVLVRTFPDITLEPPVCIVTYIIRVFFPSVVIDGETADDVWFADYLVFYCGIAFLCYLFLSYKIQKR